MRRTDGGVSCPSKISLDGGSTWPISSQWLLSTPFNACISKAGRNVGLLGNSRLTGRRWPGIWARPVRQNQPPQGALNDLASGALPLDLNDCPSCTTHVIEVVAAPSVPGPASQCAPFHEQIVAKLEQGLSAQRIWQDLVSEHGCAHKYHSVRRYSA